MNETDEQSEMMYMLVVPPVGEIERIDYSEDADEAFARVQQEASVRKGESAHVQWFTQSRLRDVIVFLDENAFMYRDLPGVDVRSNLRAAYVLDGYLGNPRGPMVITGQGSGGSIPGLSLVRTVELIKILDGVL